MLVSRGLLPLVKQFQVIDTGLLPTHAVLKLTVALDVAPFKARGLRGPPSAAVSPADTVDDATWKAELAQSIRASTAERSDDFRGSLTREEMSLAYDYLGRMLDELWNTRPKTLKPSTRLR